MNLHQFSQDSAQPAGPWTTYSASGPKHREPRWTHSTGRRMKFLVDGNHRLESALGSTTWAREPSSFRRSRGMRLEKLDSSSSERIVLLPGWAARSINQRWPLTRCVPPDEVEIDGTGCSLIIARYPRKNLAWERVVRVLELASSGILEFLLKCCLESGEILGEGSLEVDGQGASGG